MTDKQRKRIIHYLKEAMSSENPKDYIDPNEDYQWGPSLGSYANEAAKENKEIRELIRVLGGEPKKKVIKDKFSKNKFTMPFGKHKGVDITVIPHGYLHWVVDVVKEGPLKRAIEKELDKRGPYKAPRRSYRVYDRYSYIDGDEDWHWECPLNG